MKKANMTYMDSVHHYGRVWNLSMMVLLLMFPAAVSIIFHAPADGKGLLMGLIATAPMYWAVGFIETLTYVPMLGAGGSYLSFVTGNISNLKLPCALNALEQADVKANSEEGEIVSTVAIAVSSIVTTVIIILGVILIIPLTPVLESPALAPAFRADPARPVRRPGCGVHLKERQALHRPHLPDAGSLHLRSRPQFQHRRHYGAGQRAVYRGGGPHPV